MKPKTLLQKFDVTRFFKSGKKDQVPGTVEYVGAKREEPVTIQVLDFNRDNFSEKKFDSIPENFPFVSGDSVTWINVNGVHDEETIKKVGKMFGVSSMVLEDIANTMQRPKMETYPSYLFIALKMVYPDKETQQASLEQISLLLTPGLVITFQEKEGDVLESLRERIRRGQGDIRERKVDYLAYSIMDLIVDNYFPVLEDVGEEIEKLEAELVKSNKQELLNRIYRLKQEIVLIRQAAWPLRDMISNLQKSDRPEITAIKDEYLRDLQDHVLQVVEAVEIFRDMASDMQGLYLATSSHRMNEVMKVLTIFASIFIPLTFIAGLYGMNFRNLPGVYSPNGYFVIFGVMATVVVVMLVYFKIRKWF